MSRKFYTMSKNRFKPSLAGVGYLGVGPYKVRMNKKQNDTAYSVWSSIVHRVYKPHTNYIIRSYGDVTMDEKWHNYQNFAEWYYSQINRFGQVDFKWNVDKDLLFPGNRIYSDLYCCVIPSPVNTVLGDSAHARGLLPLGVTKNGPGYQAQCRTFGNSNKYLGTYKTIPEAQTVYWNYKIKAIRNIALLFWIYIPEPLAMRLIQFNHDDAIDYYGEDALIWSD